ncbi:mevalonate kinase [Gemella sp. GH3]|uniref:mevalonate kinase n=1 Tax=unclassified Gemella TaxID=2624949 RepID=UPI0015D06296|nr:MULTISPECIES: mevalonate kinase [unclassified Gemella]MBF0714225.1 mevalonate kinase [Gemella sp. GH3.1]NYS51177.1 mevalonate kinase [Gemella sp. GH3]
MTHAKAIFFGEHSVVYGKKGITIPLVEMTVSASLISTDYVQERDEIISYIAKQCNIDKNTKIDIQSTIPVGRGLGSSAALSVAIARANKCKNIEEIANKCEKFIHGNPSGIDVSQVLSNSPLLFSKEDGAMPLNFCLESYLLIIDTGIIGITKDTVSRVKKNFSNNKQYIDDLGKITEEVIPYLLNKNIEKVGYYMDKAQYLLSKIGVSHSNNDEVINICKENGALGAKITGGGDGGCCISLSKTLDEANKIQEALKQKGYSSWIISV